MRSRLLMIRSKVLLSVDARVMGLYDAVRDRSLFCFGMTVIIAVLNCGGKYAV